MVLQMLRNIAEKIRPTVIYTILADKTSDVLDREQLAFCIKWVDGSLQAHENFIDLHILPIAKFGQTIVVI